MNRTDVNLKKYVISLKGSKYSEKGETNSIEKRCFTQTFLRNTTWINLLGHQSSTRALRTSIGMVTPFFFRIQPLWIAFQTQIFRKYNRLLKTSSQNSLIQRSGNQVQKHSCVTLVLCEDTSEYDCQSLDGSSKRMNESCYYASPIRCSNIKNTLHSIYAIENNCRALCLTLLSKITRKYYSQWFCLKRLDAFFSLRSKVIEAIDWESSVEFFSCPHEINDNTFVLFPEKKRWWWHR